MNLIRVTFFCLLSLIMINTTHTGNPSYYNPSDYNQYPYSGCYQFDYEFNKFLSHYGSDYQHAFLSAARYGYNDYLKPLINLGADVNGYTDDCNGKTALMFAAEAGHAETCKILLRLGAYIDARTNWGSTALMWAAERGHLSVCKLLIKAGASIYAQTSKGTTAYSYAKKNGHYRICALLGHNEPETNFNSYNNYPSSLEYYPTPNGDNFFAGCLGVGLIALGSYVLVNSLADC